MAKKDEESPVKAVAAEQTAEEKGICFVLMPFREPFNQYFTEIYAPAIEEAGLIPKRADSLFKAGSVMRDIWEFIQNAVVIIAELTEKNPNVFYELGLTHAIGKPSILVSRSMYDVPFDIRSERTILYDVEQARWSDKLQEVITKAIQETLTSPSAAVPTVYWERKPVSRPEDDPRPQLEVDRGHFGRGSA